MAEARDIPVGTYDLKLGETFQDVSGKSVYHTLRFDFKPKSVASETETYLSFGNNGDVQVAVPGEGDSLTIYKGARKQVKADKECILFFDHNTRELRLEKLSSNISVKKTRDNDEGTVSVIRSEIQKLRRKAKKNIATKKDDEDEEMEDTKSSSGSSSSSSSESADSDSECSSSSSRHSPAGTAKETNADSSDEDDNNSASGSNDDDDLQDQLEQHLNADSMPSVDSRSYSSTAPSSSSKQSASYSSTTGGGVSGGAAPLNHHHHHHSSSTKKLLDDLQLSESSDDDDD